MSNPLDFNRLSDYINAITDRRLVAITGGLTNSSGYLRGLVTQSYNYSQDALTHASAAAGYAGEANTASATSLIVLNEFTSTYLGVSATEPERSSQGNPVNVGGWYIRQSDGRIRYVTAIDGNGVPTYADTTVTADPNSLAAAGVGVFLSLQTTSLQTVKSAVTFQNVLLGPKITNWTSQQLVTAIDVNDRVGTLTAALNTEVSRATDAETALGNNKVAKAGDTMSGALQIAASGEAPSLIVRNSTSGSGRAWRLHSTNTGGFRIYDDTGSFERLSISAAGEVSIPGGLSVGTNFASKNLFANATDATDTGFSIQRSGVNRWLVRRSESAGRFYIARYNAQGAYQDTPLYIAESDGALTTNRLVVTDTIDAKNRMTVEGAGAAFISNNTSTASDNAIQMRHNNVTRWVVGRDPRAARFYLGRYNESGQLVDVPFYIAESTGWVTVANLQSNNVIQASGEISAPMLKATASGTGRNIAIGDDAWIGDLNIPNGISIKGQGDLNAGFVVFGNSGTTLGCNANDGRLRYGGNIVWHEGNFTPSQYVRVTASSNAENGGYRVYSDGFKECWGKVTVSGNAQSQFFQFPAGVGFSSYANAQISGSSGGINAQDNFVAIAAVSINGFTVNNPDDSTVTAWYSARGY